MSAELKGELQGNAALAIEDSLLLVAELAADLSLLRWNDAWNRVAAGRAVAGASFLSLLSDDDVALAESTLSRLKTDEGAVGFDARLKGHESSALDATWIRVRARRADHPGEIRLSATDITDLKRELSRLTHENEILEAIVEHVDIGISVIDNRFHYVRANAWFRHRTASTTIDLRGRYMLEVVPPELHAGAAELQQAFFDGNPEPPLEWTRPDADGKPVSMRTAAVMLTMSDGTKYKLTTCFDITREREQAARLRLFDKMLTSTPLIFWTLDKEGRFTSSEGTGLASLGASPGSWNGRNAIEDWKGTTASPNMERALKGEEFKDTLMIPGPHFYDVWYMPLHDTVGNNDGMMGLALEVTAEKLAEADLLEKLATIQQQREALEMFNRALNSAPIVLWTVDREGNYTLSEGKGLELIGFKRGEAVGLNALEMFRGMPIEESIRAALKGQEMNLLTEAAPGVFFENWYMPIIQPETGEVSGVMGLAIDSSERIRGERELREKLDLIERQSATIRALATPIIRVWDEVLCLPVIGTVDSQRTADMMDSLLQSIVREQARFAIVDLTGVEVVDTSTADHLIRLFKAAKVLGVDGVLCGIQPAVAQTVVALGMDLGEVRTMRTLQDALKWCIASRADAVTRSASTRRIKQVRSTTSE
ncbi:MAG: PAS domain S-box protein [Polyangiaceae bacterium]